MDPLGVFFVDTASQIRIIASVFDPKSSDAAKSLFDALTQLHNAIRLIPDVITLDHSPVRSSLETTMGDLQTLITRLMERNYPKGKGKLSVRKRLDWILRQDETEKALREINEYKSTLTLLISIHHV